MQNLVATARLNSHRGGMPSEILPGLFLSGHPARTYNSGAARAAQANPSKYLAETHAVKLIVNCCAGKSLAAGVVENLATGEKRAVEEFEAFLEMLREHCAANTTTTTTASTMFHLNIAADDVEEYNITPHLAPAVQCIAAVVAGTHNELCALATGTSSSSLDTAAGRSMIATRGGILAHCQMGVSRSATIISAYLMARFGVSSEEAIDFVQSRRRQADPNAGFRKALLIWEDAAKKIAIESCSKSSL